MRLLVKIGLLGVFVCGAGAGILSAAPNDSTDSNSSSVAEIAPILSRLREDAQHVERLQQIARKDKDVIKLNCVNDKLVELKPKLNLADALMGAIRGGGAPQVSLSQFSSIADDVRHLREEADQCVGDSAIQAESSNDVTGPGLPDPGNFNPWQPGTIVEPPALASPFN